MKKYVVELYIRWRTHQTGSYLHPLGWREVEAASPKEAAEKFAGCGVEPGGGGSIEAWFFDFEEPRYRKYGLFVVGDNPYRRDEVMKFCKHTELTALELIKECSSQFGFEIYES